MHICSIPKSRRGGSHALDLAAYRRGTRYDVPQTRFIGRARHSADHRERADVYFSEILAPEAGSVPAWVAEPQLLWTRADEAENRRDSRIAREWIVALPRDLGRSEVGRLAKAVAQMLADRYGVVCDLSVHIAPGTDVSSGSQYKPHVHILTTTRRIGPEGFGPKSEIELSDEDLRRQGLPGGAAQIDQVRAKVAALTNAALAAAGKRRRVSHLSYRRRGMPLYGRGAPKRHGRTARLSIRQKDLLRRHAARPSWSVFGTDADRRVANAKVILARPAAYYRLVEDLNGVPTLATLRAALRPLVPTDQLDEVAATVEREATIERGAKGAALASRPAALGSGSQGNPDTAADGTERNLECRAETVVSGKPGVSIKDPKPNAKSTGQVADDEIDPFVWSELPGAMPGDKDAAKDRLRRKKEEESRRLLHDWKERVEGPRLRELDRMLERMRGSPAEWREKKISSLSGEDADRDVQGEGQPKL